MATVNNTRWVITEAEQRQNEIQFATLSPVNGLVSGEQVRPFFMKSGLSPAILAQIWQLADYTKVCFSNSMICFGLQALWFHVVSIFFFSLITYHFIIILSNYYNYNVSPSTVCFILLSFLY